MDARRVLLVAPDMDLRNAVAFSLGAHGYQVVAVSQMQDPDADGHFDCSVIDEPALRSFDASLEHFCTSHAPVLLMAYSQAARKQSGFHTILDKPLQGEDLVQAILMATGHTAPAATT